MKAKCCYLGDSSGPCPNDAEWQVFFDESPDGSTLACTQHVGIMCADDYHNVVTAFSEEEKRMVVGGGGPGTNTGHGHVWERPDGVKARCGGTGLCPECARDAHIYARRSYANPPTYEDLVAQGQDPSTGGLPGEIHPA